MSCEPASLVGVELWPVGLAGFCWVLGGLVGAECLSVVYGWCALLV